MAAIEYYLFGGSPFTYLGHRALIDMARRHNATIHYKPVDLMAVWAVSGAVPPGQRSPVRQRYRLIELQRWAAMRGLPVNLKPRHWPADTALADRAAIAISETGGDPGNYLERVLAGVWAEEADMADRATIADRLSASGFVANDVLARAESDEIAEIRERNTEEAIAADAIGAPSYVLNGEVFWGQDRIDLLEQALASGRPPFRP